MLEKDFEYYLENQNDLLQSFKDSFIVIQNQTVLKALKSMDDAYQFLVNHMEEGSFLVQEVNEDQKARTAMFTL